MTEIYEKRIAIAIRSTKDAPEVTIYPDEDPEKGIGKLWALIKGGNVADTGEYVIRTFAKERSI